MSSEFYRYCKNILHNSPNIRHGKQITKIFEALPSDVTKIFFTHPQNENIVAFEMKGIYLVYMSYHQNIFCLIFDADDFLPQSKTIQVMKTIREEKIKPEEIKKVILPPTPPTNTYQKIKKLGSGAFGTTYLVKKKDQEYVMKVIHSHRAKGKEEALKQYQNLKLLEPVCKRFICPIELFDDDGNLIIVMEYLKDYMNLKEYLESQPEKLDNMENRKKIANQLISDLSLLHQHDLVHRDIKLDNIMIHPETLDVRFIDFGLSLPKNKCPNYPAGTPAFMPSNIYEAFLNRKELSFLDFEQGDWYALGLVLVILMDYYKGLPEDFFKNIHKKSLSVQRHLKKYGFSIKMKKNE